MYQVLSTLKHTETSKENEKQTNKKEKTKGERGKEERGKGGGGHVQCNHMYNLSGKEKGRASLNVCDVGCATFSA